ncbi:MAG: hypothetical protein HYX87_01855 [Chloroflexi bacterium]|nr:hypothetical protein [Chloroflexota bacterium]
MIVARAPMRVPLGGGGTDLPSYYCQYGGFLVSAAVDKYTYVTVNPRFEDSIRVSYAKTEIVDNVQDIQHPLVREALKLLDIQHGLEIVSIADVPSNTGLGSSGSFLVSLLLALHTYKREPVTPAVLAEEAFHIEAEVLGEPVGKQDQYAAAYGGVVAMKIDETGKVMVEPMALSPHVQDELETSLLFFYTGIRRSASEVLAGQNAAAKSGDSVVSASLCSIKDIGYRVRSSLESGDLETFGQLMDIHWQTKKRLSARVTSADIDQWYNVARGSGALGGKIMGAGGGGCFMFYANHGDKTSLRKAMAKEGLKEIRLRIVPEGAKVLLNI